MFIASTTMGLSQSHQVGQSHQVEVQSHQVGQSHQVEVPVPDKEVSQTLRAAWMDLLQATAISILPSCQDKPRSRLRRAGLPLSQPWLWPFPPPHLRGPATSHCPGLLPILVLAMGSDGLAQSEAYP